MRNLSLSSPLVGSVWSGALPQSLPGCGPTLPERPVHSWPGAEQQSASARSPGRGCPAAPGGPGACRAGCQCRAARCRHGMQGSGGIEPGGQPCCPQGCVWGGPESTPVQTSPLTREQKAFLSQSAEQGAPRGRRALRRVRSASPSHGAAGSPSGPAGPSAACCPGRQAREGRYQRGERAGPFSGPACPD